MKMPETVEDIMLDPHRYGIPTCEEYLKNSKHYREKFFGRDDDEFASIDAGLKLIKQFVRTQKYFVEGYECASLEEADRTAANMGFKLTQLVPKPELIPNGGGKADLHVYFISKERADRIDTEDRKRLSIMAARAKLGLSIDAE